MQRIISKTIALLVLITCTTACNHSEQSQKNRKANNTAFYEPFNGIYFWRTTFSVSDEERTFLEANKVDRLYLRLFDVDVAQQNLLSYEEPLPIATLIFPDSAITAQTTSMVRDIVPVCFITLSALKQMKGKETEYAEHIVKRMLNMSSYHGFRDKVTEVQIDCDWTEKTEDLYFTLLNKVKKLLSKEKVSLSVTVRLHQLRTNPPPADRGVLMVYNTGSIMNPHTENSILSLADAAQYLTHSAVERYAIPLDYALPTFSWGVWFNNEQYMGILHCSDFDNPHYYAMVDSTHYKVLHPHIVEERKLMKGDIIRVENSNYETILKIKALLPFNEQTPARPQSVILYHLDANNLKEYETDQIETLYRHSAGS